MSGGTNQRSRILCVRSVGTITWWSCQIIRETYRECMTIEENWAVNHIRTTLAACETCTVEIDLLYCERIHKPELKDLCTSEYWYIDPLSDGYRTFIIHKDYLRLDSCTRKICGYTAQQAVEEKIDQRYEVIFKPIMAMEITDEIIPQTRRYRIEWLSRPLHRIYDEQKEYIPIWHLP